MTHHELCCNGTCCGTLGSSAHCYPAHVKMTLEKRPAIKFTIPRSLVTANIMVTACIPVDDIIVVRMEF
eukprot:scaffold65193_cov41-Attheya_sp.AAC.1